MKNAVDGYKKLGVLLAAIVGLPLTDIPVPWIWPLAVIVCAYLVIQGAIDFATAWKGGK